MLKDECKFCSPLHPWCLRFCLLRETNRFFVSLTVLLTLSGRDASGYRCVVAFLWWLGSFYLLSLFFLLSTFFFF